MSLPLVVRRLAERDLADARDWYEEQRSGLGSEFLTAVEASFSVLHEFPYSFAVEFKKIRCAMLSRFPYVVYYRIKQESVEVLAVIHGRRDPRAWQSRID